MGKMAGEDIKTDLRLDRKSMNINDRDRIAASLIRESGGDQATWARWRNKNENFDKIAKVSGKEIKGPAGRAESTL